MPTSLKPVRATFECLIAVVLAVVLLAILALCVWQIIHGLKGGDLVCPLYRHGSIIFTQQDSPWGFWTVIAFYLAVGSATAMILLKALWKRARP